ncbi:MAG: helix-turn-helix transcriptional regulator [Saprospiraceae bacterium]|nr:helix-turn-helix transcriptional regulator [Saprospiraceae bacterium]
MKKGKEDIKTVQLDSFLHQLHKDYSLKSDFGLDGSKELVEGGFGLYSSTNIKDKIGPIKTQYFRISLVRSGSAQFDIGLESYQPGKDFIVFGFPGQIFSLYNKSQDFKVYYMLFSEEFMGESLLKKNKRDRFPFFNYTGVHCFKLEESKASEVENIIFKINDEIKYRQNDLATAVRLYVQLILLLANREYERLELKDTEKDSGANALFTRFIKLVGQHFLQYRKVSDYAELLHISSDHLNRIIKAQSDKTAGELIDAMLLNEAKAYLLYTQLSNAEIAYRLDFSDPSHFNKFFKKLTSFTPVQYRERS